VKSLLAITLFAALALGVNPTMAEERACRPSLSNFYHCPDTSAPTKPTVARESKTCHPSISNAWSCPDSSPVRKSASTRACRPSLSNGYSCPGNAPASPKADRGTVESEDRKPKTTATTERGCRPSLSNGYKCPDTASRSEKPSDAAQYTTEGRARAHCPGDTVVWANTRSNIYHFQGTGNYGNTKAGAYMCEQDSLNEGMRAAKNETHP
jgi:hypothetical protein